MAQEKTQEAQAGLKEQLRTLQREFVRCSLQNSFDDSEMFLGSRHKGLRMIRDLRKDLAKSRARKTC